MQLLEARRRHSSKCSLAGWVFIKLAAAKWFPVGACINPGRVRCREVAAEARQVGNVRWTSQVQGVVHSHCLSAGSRLLTTLVCWFSSPGEKHLEETGQCDESRWEVCGL